MFVFGIHKKAISKKSRRNCEGGAGSSLEERGKLCDKVKEETLTMSHKDLNDTMSQKE